MFKSLLTFALLLLVPLIARAQIDQQLVGKYRMDVQGGDLLELRANGTANLDGEEMQWSVKGKQLKVGTDVMSYSLQGERLILTMGNIPIPWKRISGESKPSPFTQRAQTMQAQRAAPSAPTPPVTGGNAQDVQARQVLVRSAWCSFTYNKVSGSSSTRKVVFRPDGIMTVNGGGETYSSGYGGTYASQTNTAGTMLWKLENLRLYIDPRDGSGFQDIGLTATTNSNGSIILRAVGREYSMCN
ncbi:hypothetical protein BH11PSE11_BH11PSE11_32590 [soil metagenome]